MIYSVALDGPGGAGKSTIARKVAALKGILYVDTGAMYRAVALYMLENGVDINDEKSVCAALENVQVDLAYQDGAQRVLLCGEDVSEAIRQSRVSMAASVTSAYKCVRAFLLDAQRDVAARQSVVMDGRDIGTVVLPSAQVKIFLTADSRVRARRRYKELTEKGVQTDFDSVLADIEKRDWQDIHRRQSPLKQAEDAVLVDTSEMDFDRAVRAVLTVIENKLGE